MASTKDFYTRIQNKHDTAANWAKATGFAPLAGEIIIYDTDSNNTNPKIKIGDGSTNINNLPFLMSADHNHDASNITSGTISTARLPAASGTQAGITIVWPAASCTTFSSDSGTVTPLAVQKGVKMFAITRPPKKSSNEGDTNVTINGILRWEDSTGDVKDSKIKIEDVANTKNSNLTGQVISVPTPGNKKMVYGYCTDQDDGTAFIGGLFNENATTFPYASGLAIGGSSTNLLWKGNRVLDTTDKYAGSSTLGGSATSAVKLDTTTAGSATQPVYFTGGKPVATTYTLEKSVPSDAKFTDTTYSAATTSTAGLMSAADKSKLDGIASGANAYTHPTSAGNKHIPSGGSSGQFLKWSASGTATWAADNNTTYTFATGDSNGQIKVTPSGGSAQNISIKGLGTAAYTASTAYATAAQGTLAANAMPKAGGTFTGNVIAYSTNRSGANLRNINVQNSSGTNQSTNYIIMKRK